MTEESLESDRGKRLLQTMQRALERFHDIRIGETAPLVERLGYDYPHDGANIAYGWQEPDFTRELVNAHNHFALLVDRLAAWEQVLREFTEDEATTLAFEFVELPLDYCLHFPYRFKQQVTFCATQLCYIAGVPSGVIAREQVMDDDRVDLASLDSAARRWSAGPSLVAAIKQIDGTNFRTETRQYRRRAQHRFPPRLGFGHVAQVRRSFPPGKLVSYSMEVEHPIQIGEVLPTLVAEAKYLGVAFRAYRALVDEHCPGEHWRPAGGIHADGET